MGQSQSSGNGSGTRRDENASSETERAIENSSRDGSSDVSRSQRRATRTSSHKRTMPGRRSRAVRKSILNLVKPRENEAEINEEDTRTETETSGHRSAWRRSIGFVKSRRWSKAPAHSITNGDVLGDTDPAPDSNDNLPSSSLNSQRAAESPTETRDSNLESDIPSSSETPLVEPDDSTASSQLAPALATEISEATSAENGASTINAPANVDSTMTSTATTTGPARQQFPPSGTLVVVQGVVHTTDVPIPAGLLTQTQNPNNTNLEPPQIQDDPRPSNSNRLSALLRRSPESQSRSRPESSASVHADSPGNELPMAIASEYSGENSTSEVETGVHAPLSTPSPPSPPQRPPPPEDLSGSISSSSIDVLGTLLSVAAAATAASLLTGTSDISSLPPTSSDSSRSSALNNPLPPTISPSSQSSPSITENTSFSERVPANTGVAGDRDRADRMRQVWSTVRNRLGLQPSNRRSGYDPRPVHDAITDSDTAVDAERRASDVEPLANPRDARERMLSEIARAFNLGISASPPSSPSNTATESTGSESPNPRRAPGSTDALGLPAEGTFERFLLDLQIDLRGVLTGREIARHSEAGRTESGSMTNTEGALTEELSQPDVEPEPEPEDDEETSSTSSMHSSMHNLSDLPVDAESPSSDSTSVGSVAENATTPSTAVNNVPSGPPHAPNRINYWRLYRFPPIAAPRAHAAAESVAQNMRSGLGGLNRVSPVTRASPLQSPASPPIAGESSADAGSSTQPIQNSPAANTTVNNDVVIPVIIVGLQSVNAIWATEPLVPAVAGAHTLAARPNPPVDADTDEARGGNRWPSRAANALRSLRRQSTPTPPTTSLFQDEDVDSSQSVPIGMTSQGTQTQQLPGATQTAAPVPFPDILSAPGSRTFLIYVIGGYYPPDHEIVTGADESGILDSSFEALLSLNELLNHAESPLTVSKDQLEKSGLQIIQGEQINEWENLGKVRSNCVERCLICLDEYAQHDSVRVMECKHAFHMDCVDRWLLECRNSCPACRGKGVEDNEAQSS